MHLDFGVRNWALCFGSCSDEASPIPSMLRRITDTERGRPVLHLGRAECEELHSHGEPNGKEHGS